MGTSDEISQALRRKGVDTACRRCGKDDWSMFSDSAIVPEIPDQVSMAGGTAAAVHVCSHCGCIELYNPGMLNG